MTIFQIVALIICGPIVLMTFAQLLVTLIFKNQNTFKVYSAILLMIGVVVILVSFLGVQ